MANTDAEATEKAQPPSGGKSGARGTTADSDLSHMEVVRGLHPGDRHVRIRRHRDFQRPKPGHLIPREGVGQSQRGISGAVGRLKRALLGRPLATWEEARERVNVFTGLAVFASDNISSSAYATEEIMRVLVLAGIGALTLTLPITLVIITVLAVVVVSYQQTIAAYPRGGGSYIVTSDNLGTRAGLVAAAALLSDYVLTVAVSIAAGVAALTSIWPALFEYRVLIGVTFVGLLCLGNLRGIRESGVIFSAPTYVYLLAMFGLLAYGLWLFVTGGLPTYVAPPEWNEAHGMEALGVLLILRAFASGSVALTGTEAVADGVPAFKPPEARHAQIVLILMGTCFATIFLGISFLAMRLGIVPDPSEQETVISLLTSTLVGAGSPYHYIIQVATALLLVLAANTAFADFPRLGSFLARDRFLPRTFAFRGDRLAFTTGIVLLAAIAAGLIVGFQGSVTNLIPLYTVGVFAAFTLSQIGMVRHWRKLRSEQPGWWWRAMLNGLGATATGTVAVVVGVAKFALGAWMVLILIPLLVGMMWAIRSHYLQMGSAVRPETPTEPEKVCPRIIVPIARLDVPARQALAFAHAIADEQAVTAVHVTDDLETAEQLRTEWQASPYSGGSFVVIESKYRALAGPFLAYIDALHERHPEQTIAVVLPEYVPSHWWEHLLHNQTALRLKAALLFHPGIVVVNVPYHLAVAAQ
jgi:amino acid transporter